MATPFCEIIDNALITIKDYKLDALYEKNPEAFVKVLTGYMLRELPKFTDCLKPLTYDIQTEEFDSDFDIYEISIIADWTVIGWYLDNAQDVLEFKDALQNKEFKRRSAGENLKERQNYIRLLREKVKQDGTNYQLLHLGELPFFDGRGYCLWG